MSRDFDLNAATRQLAQARGISFQEARAYLGRKGAEARKRKNRRLQKARQQEERRGLQ